MIAKVRLPQNMPNEVSILQVATKWRVFVRQRGEFAVTPFEMNQMPSLMRALSATGSE